MYYDKSLAARQANFLIIFGMFQTHRLMVIVLALWMEPWVGSVARNPS